MVSQNSSLARRTSVEACFTGPTVISLATDHRTSGFRDDCLQVLDHMWDSNLVITVLKEGRGLTVFGHQQAQC